MNHVLSKQKIADERTSNSITNYSWNRKFSVRVCTFLCCFMLVLTGCSNRATSQSVQSTGVAMGTTVSMKLYCDVENGGKSGQTIEELWKLVSDLEENSLSRRMETSEISQVNARINSGEQDIPVSGKLQEYLTLGRQIWEDSRGAFDLTLGELTSLWRIDERAGEEAILPEEKEIIAAMNHSGFEKLSSDENGILKADGSVSLDLGAVGKGIALDQIRDCLSRQSNVTGAVVSMGGSILVYGEKPEHADFKVAVVDPLDTANTVGTISLNKTACVSTSGGYERYITNGGKRYHHILNPHTGYPAESDVLSATVVSDSGYLSDALSTACFILGSTEGLKLAEKYDAQVLFVTTSNQVVMSEGLQELFSKTASSAF